VLHELAADRQVVVFTHDDRLPDAVLRLGYAATVLRVERSPGSVVKIDTVEDAADRALRDATTLARDKDLDPRLAFRSVVGSCRAAVEARAVQRYRRDQQRKGVPVEAVDGVLGGLKGSIWDRVSLALEGDAVPDMKQRMDRRNLGREASLIGRLNSGGHEPRGGGREKAEDPLALIADTRDAIEKLFPR